MRCMLNLTDSVTLTTIIPGFIALKIDKTAEIKIDRNTRRACTIMHHDEPLFVAFLSHRLH
jgi:hypothetical protein